MNGPGIVREKSSDEEDVDVDEALAKTGLVTSIPDADIPTSIRPFHTGRAGWKHKLVPARKVRGQIVSRRIVDAQVSIAVTPEQVDLNIVFSPKLRSLTISPLSPDRQIVALREKRPEMVWQS